MRRFYGWSHWETLHFTPQTLPSLISDSSQKVHDVSDRQNQPGIIEIKGLKTSTLRKAKQLHWTGEKKVQWGVSNVLKVSLQTTIYSLAVRGWSQRRIASELGINCETVRRYLRLANRPFRSPALTGLAHGSSAWRGSTGQLPLGCLDRRWSALDLEAKREAITKAKPKIVGIRKSSKWRRDAELIA